MKDNINIRREMMKLRTNVITAMVIVSFLLVGTTSALAQGIYSNTTNTTTTESNGNTRGGLFRSDDDGFGNDGNDGIAPGLNSDPDPIGEGILILSLLSGAYALVKRNLKNKHED